ncbi:MAG: penicillin-insensitive murein endopeptidase, partial [Methylovirgula sp.]
MRGIIVVAAGATVLALAALAHAQQVGTLEPKPLPPLAHPNAPGTPAKALFGRFETPAGVATRTIGFYARGCLSGGIALPVNGPDWQVMRVSR